MTCFLTFFVISILGLAFLAKLYVKLTTGICKSRTCLAGKTAIITGSNTGIGFETALDFAQRGARVILACRDKEKAEEARKRIIRETGNENVVVKIIDMSSFSSVKSFAKEINESEERLDILVNNAGAGGIGDKRSKDGNVLLMQINYLSACLLTILLLELLKKSAPSRIVNVSSIAAKLANFDLKKINEFPGMYNLYANTKLCNILFTIQLAKKLNGTGVTVYSLHPGAVNTDIFRRIKGWHLFVLLSIQKFLFKNSEEGAQTIIYTAVAKDIEEYDGEHFQDCKRVDRYETAKDPKLAEEVFEATMEILQIKPEEIKFD